MIRGISVAALPEPVEIQEESQMKHHRTLLAVAVVFFAIAMPSISAAQYYHEERLDHFISERPDLRNQLERNPNLIYNREWREKETCPYDLLQKHTTKWGGLPQKG